MRNMRGIRSERLDHLGIVAGVCQEIGLAEYLDARAGPREQQVSVGTATVAMILNGLGFSNRRLYLVSQFFATKPVEHLLGPGIRAELLHDDCLGRTLDWLYTHDPTTLFAGIARQARERFGVEARQVHVDTTSFSVSAEYAPDPEDAEEADADVQVVAVTYGYSRDHREDLKQWMLALATTRQGDIPLYLHTLDGNASDKVSLVAAVEALGEQLQGEGETPIFVADSGMYSRENMARLNQAQVCWISRVPETSGEAKAAVREADTASWQQTGALCFAPVATAPRGERWVVGRTVQGQERTRATLSRKAEQTRVEWEKTRWHLSVQRFACEPDAQAALSKQLSRLPSGSRWRLASSPFPPIPGAAGRARTLSPTACAGRSRPPSPSTRPPWSGSRRARRASWWPPMSWTLPCSPTRSCSRPTRSRPAWNGALLF
jgi:transposase